MHNTDLSARYIIHIDYLYPSVHLTDSTILSYPDGLHNILSTRPSDYADSSGIFTYHMNMSGPTGAQSLNIRSTIYFTDTRLNDTINNELRCP